MDEDEFRILEELNEELNKRSFKVVNRTDTVKYACKFTKENIDMIESVKALHLELEELKLEYKLYKNSFLEFHDMLSVLINRTIL